MSQPTSAHAHARMVEDHQEVRATTRVIEDEVTRLEGQTPEERGFDTLSELLRAFHGVLRDHFLLEEQEGFRGLPRDPATMARIDQLIVQHREFLTKLDRILSSIEEGGEDFVALARELENFFANLRWHDSVETSLLHRV